MAEKPTNSGPSLSIGMIFLLIVIGVFIVWVLMGGPTDKTSTKTKIIEKSAWPPTDDIGTFGGPAN